MGTATRKQREIQQRELLLLDIGRRMLIEHGFAGLSMDRLAEATEYSKGTVYQHFSTKEDLVAALATQSTERRFELFERACGFDGRPRERLAAIAVADELFARLHPHYFRSELVVKMAALGDRVTAERLANWNQVEECCSKIIVRLIDDAITVGDLILPPRVTPGGIMFGLFSLAVGAHIVMMTHAPLLEFWAVGPAFEVLGRNMQAFLDGYGVQPLSSEWDYAATRARVVKEVFPDECRSAGFA